MTAPRRFDAILFDCDGVLVDSEPITQRVLRDRLAAIGWEMTLEECMRIFIGKMVRDQRDAIERHTGRPFTEDWLQAFYAARNQALEDELLPIPHIHAAIAAVQAGWGDRFACASGADRAKIELQLRKVGLAEAFGDRVFSGHEMPRSKPAPDVYLAAAASLGADPARCAVVEDTVTGATAGVAAGATVFGYSPSAYGHDAAEALRAAGAVRVFGDMRELAGLLAQGG
jgi:HAD superfamily hydrolase (TIGR01509 family)